MADFAQTIAAAYAVRAPRSTSAAACTTARSQQAQVVQVPLAMMNRHGLVAGATGTGKTKTLQGMRRAALGRRRRRCSSPTSRATSPAWPRRRRRRDSAAERDARARASPSTPTASRSSSCRSAASAPGVPVRATRLGLRPAAAGQGARRQRDAGVEPRLVFHYADTKGAAAARPLRPARAADVPGLRRRQGRARGHRRAVVGDRRRAAARPRRRSRPAAATSSSASRSSTISRPAAHARPTAAASSPASSCRPSRTSRALLDRADVAARRAVRGAARGRRPRQAQARLLLRRGPPAVQRRQQGVRLESVTQTVRLIRSKGVGVFFVTQTPKDVPGDVLGQLGNRSSTRCAPSRRTTQKALKATVVDLPKSEFYDLEALLTVDGHRRGRGDGARRARRADARSSTRGCRRRSASMGPADDVDGAAKASPLCAKYGTRVDGESAREMLAARDDERAAPADAPPTTPVPSSPRRPRRADARRGTPLRAAAPEQVGDFLNSRQGKQLQSRSCGGSSACCGRSCDARPSRHRPPPSAARCRCERACAPQTAVAEAAAAA